MNRPNIISAGKMMSIVAILLGAVFCIYNIPSLIPLGATLALCGIAMAAMFGRVDDNRKLATPVLIVSTLAALVGIVSVALVYRNPFSWMMAIVSLAIFIDALCLKLSMADKTARARRV